MSARRAAPIVVTLLLSACGIREGEGRLDAGVLASEPARGLVDAAWTSTEALAALVDEPAFAGQGDARTLLEIATRGGTAEIRVAALRAIGSLPGDLHPDGALPGDTRTVSGIGKIARGDPDALVRETAADTLAGIAERSPEEAPLVAREVALALETESSDTVRAALLDVVATLHDEPTPGDR